MLTLDTERPVHGGFVLARVPEGDDAGKVAVVAGALPGERVIAKVVENKKKHVVAEVVEVLIPSPDRVADAPALGANLSHVSPEAQVPWKRDVIGDAMTRIGGPEVAQAVGSVAVRSVSGTGGWRTRAEFVTDDDGQISMRAPRSRELIQLSDFPQATEELNHLVFSSAWNLPSGTAVRAVAPSASAPVLVTPAGVFSAPGVSASARVKETVATRYGNLDYTLHARGFWQAHRHAPETLVAAVLDGAQAREGQTVIELFSGAGLFTQPLALAVGKKGRIVTREGSKTAVKDAVGNLAHLPQVSTSTGSVTHRSVRAMGPADVVVLDPPRTGAGIDVVRAVMDSCATRIVYVACDPVALARDLKILVQNYRVESFDAIDLFPSTHHVEAVVTLVRAT